MSIAPKMLLSLGLLAAPLSAAVVTVDTNFAGGTDGSVIYTSSGQTGVTSSSYATSTSGTSGKVVGLGGSLGSRTTSAFVMSFRLPTLPAGQEITAASLSVALNTKNGTPTFNADLWGLGYRLNTTAATTIVAGTTSGGVSTSTGDLNDVDGDGNPTVAGTATVQFSDTVDLGAASNLAARVKVSDNVFTPTTANGAAVTVSVLDYVKALYAAGAAATESGTTAGYSTGVGIFRLAPDANINLLTGSTVRYDLFTNNDGGATVPTLSLTFAEAPEPATLSLLAVAGVLVARRRRRA